MKTKFQHLELEEKLDPCPARIKVSAVIKISVLAIILISLCSAITVKYIWVGLVISYIVPYVGVRLLLQSTKIYPTSDCVCAIVDSKGLDPVINANYLPDFRCYVILKYMDEYYTVFSEQLQDTLEVGDKVLCTYTFQKENWLYNKYSTLVINDKGAVL